MIDRRTYKKTIWLDVTNPTTDEIREIMSECKIPLEFGNDLTTMIPRSEVFAKKDILKITLDFPIVKRTDINHPHEIKFIATKKHLITIHFEEIEALDRFKKEFEVASILKHSSGTISGGHLCMSLLDNLYRTMTVKLDFLESKMSEVEDMIFQSKEKEMVVEISLLNRKLITFNQTLYIHKEALESLQEKVIIAFGKTYEKYVHVLQKEYCHQINRIDALSHTLDELRYTNDSLLTTKQNEVIKTLTILAFITFPLTLFSSVFGMNTKSAPIIGKDGDFWVIVSIMAFASISFFVFFKYKKWM